MTSPVGAPSAPRSGSDIQTVAIRVADLTKRYGDIEAG
jgi:hypothetical protein